MVDFEFNPVKKIIIHEILKWSMEEFIARFVKPNSPLQWVDGIVMQKSTYKTQTTTMIDDELNGVVHWAMVEFAEMADYKPTLGNEIEGEFAPITDVSNNNGFKDFARWLKNDPRWFSSSGE